MCSKMRRDCLAVHISRQEMPSGVTTVMRSLADIDLVLGCFDALIRSCLPVKPFHPTTMHAEQGEPEVGAALGTDAVRPRDQPGQRGECVVVVGLVLPWRWVAARGVWWTPLPAADRSARSYLCLVRMSL